MNLQGVLTPIPTPFDSEGALDLARLDSLLKRLVQTRLTGIVVLGSNGEAPLLDEDESDRIIGAARELVPRDRTFIAGTGRESTRATVAAIRRAAAAGADAVLVRTPGFFKTQMTTEAFVRHYTIAADTSPVPVLLYNFTAVTGVNLPVDAVARLASHPNIAGMKESNGDVVRVAELVATGQPRFKVLVGSAATFYEAIRVGAVGGILALGSVLPDACTQLLEWTVAGRHDDARALQQRLLPAAKLLGSLHGVPALKAALRLIGCDTGAPRSPLLPLDSTVVAQIADALSSFEEVRPDLGLYSHVRR
jgi:4-hydroxy-2-oxoglutarate aldolase